MNGESTTVATFDIQSGTSPTVATVSWAAIFAGGVAAASISLILLAFGAGVGFSTISPWSTTAASTTFHIATGLYFIVTAMIASAVGGYLTGRLRMPWPGTHTREVFFRDTAHGFLAWGFATLLSAVVLSSAAGALVNGTASALTRVAGQSPGLLDGFVDSLTRGSPAATTNAADTMGARAAVGRIFATSFRNGGEFQTTDRSYLAQIVVARTGLSEAQAEQRVAVTIAQATAAANQARKAAAQLSLWLTAALLIGAFSASLAAIEGGGLRDGTWRYKV